MCGGLSCRPLTRNATPPDGARIRSPQPRAAAASAPASESSMAEPRELRSRPVGGNGRRRQRSKPKMAQGSDGFSSKPGMNKLHQAMDESPDSKCPICLDRFENVAYLNRCYHRFCFRCVQEWSKNKAECPLCKQPFHSIIHSMRSDDDFKEYIVRPSENGSFASPDGRRFRYRTTLTREHHTSGFPPRNSSAQRTVSPPDNGVLFEGLSSQPPRYRIADMQQMFRRLTSMRRANLEGRSVRQIQEQEIINFRRALYRSGTRVRNIDDGGRYRDISAEFFRRNPACLHRLVPWLKRELTVLFGAHGSLVNIVQHIIMSNVTRYDLESQAFVNDLKPFLLNRTEHFLHEFINFARCPFNIDAYDQHANYDCPAPSYEEGSRSDSSIITISPGEADSREPEQNAFTSGIGQAPWDDETPGPSYSSAADQVCAAVAASVDTTESSDEELTIPASKSQIQASVAPNKDSDGSMDNCVIVGYVKPLAERTPELVELSSDSEGSVDNGKSEAVSKVLPVQYRSFSDTDASGSASPYSFGCREGRSSYKRNSPPSSKIKSKRSEKEKAKTRECTSRNWLPSSAAKRGIGGNNDNDVYRLSKRRKSESRSQHSHSRERHGMKRKRKHRSMEKQKKRRDHSKHKHKKDKKKSRDENLSRKSQALSLSSESNISQDLRRSRSRSNEYRRRRSKSKDNDYYQRDHCHSRYKWEYSFHSTNAARDGYEFRRRTEARAHYPRQSSPDYRLQSFSDRIDRRSPKGHNESRYYYYEQRRSRSPSSSRSQTPSMGPERMRSEKPSGKRKYKTHHLESARRANEEASSAKEGNALPELLPSYRDDCKEKNSFSDMGPEPDSQSKKRRRSRSPSVEIVYEGKVRNARRLKTSKRQKRSNTSHSDCSLISSPVVITIDSDSDKEPEAQGNAEYDSSFSWSPTGLPNERQAESPFSFERRDYSDDDRGDEEESMDKESNIAATAVDARDESLDEVPQLLGRPSRHVSAVSGDQSWDPELILD